MSEVFVFEEQKHSDEAWFVSIDTTTWLAGESISSVDYEAYDSSGTDVSATLLDATKNTESGATIKPWIRAGTHNTRYSVVCTVTSNAAESPVGVFIIKLLVYDSE